MNTLSYEIGGSCPDSLKSNNHRHGICKHSAAVLLSCIRPKNMNVNPNPIPNSYHSSNLHSNPSTNMKKRNLYDIAPLSKTYQLNYQPPSKRPKLSSSISLNKP